MDAPVGKELAIKIMEATDRFKFITEMKDGFLLFADYDWDTQRSINPGWSLEELMSWITELYSEEFLWKGEQKAQRKMRIALGLD